MSVLASFIEGIASGKIRVVDLTHTLHPGTPTIQLPPEFNPSWPFSLEVISKYDEGGPFFYWNNFKCGEHTGTHFDAPIHWITGKDYPNNATDTIPVKQFFAPACVVDVVDKVAADADFLLEVSHLRDWEEEHGRIEAGSWCLMRTGWSSRKEADKYLNMHEDGAHTPGPHPDALKFLIEERDVCGFGSETVGTDCGQAHLFDPPFPCHNMMHGANKFGLASLNNLDKLPPKGAVIVAAPLKIIEGSGSPTRVLALVSD